ncbi:MAG: galactitol-1-phosphate 5-dehydrogenase [Anaerovoracaceae bacterium]
MKALNLHGVNDLRYEDVEKPEPKNGEVLLKIHACGICSSDEDRIFKTGTYNFPTIPGHEFSGQIVKLGEDVDESYLGRKASVFPLLPCQKCNACKSGEYAMCSNYKYFGSRNNGAFAEYLVVPTWNIVLLDDSIEYTVGALMEPAAVALHAVNVGRIKKGERIAVIGTGTIGILIGMFSKLRGAKVFICGRRKESLESVKKFGLNSINIKEEPDMIKEVTNGERMDVVFEAVGSNDAMKTAIMNTKSMGTIIAVGNPQEDFILPKDVYWKILRWQLKIKGVWNSDYSIKRNDWETVAKLMKEQQTCLKKLITKTYHMDEYKEAFSFLTDKSKSKTKLMFVM